MNTRRKSHLDLASIATLVLTVVLFVIALFEKGFTHEILLEAGVFLVSVKLVINSQKTNFENKEMNEKLDRLLDKLK